jgi:hypothetical protein
MRTLPKGAASGLVRAVLPKSGASYAAMTLPMLFRFNLSGRLAALTLMMNIGILSGLSIDNHSLPCVYHHLQLSDNL